MAKKRTYEKTNDGPMNLFANIVSSLSPFQILGRDKVLCKSLGPAKVFCEKFESS